MKKLNERGSDGRQNVVDKSKPPEQWSKGEVRRTFQLDIGATLLYSVYGVVLTSFPAILIRQQGAPTWIVSLVIAAPSIGSFSAIFWSRLTERTPKMRVMLLGGGLARLSIMLMLLAFNPIIFALVMILTNVLEISKSPSYAGIMQQVYPNHRRSELMGKVRVATSIGTIISSMLIGQLFQVVDFRYVYAVAGLFGLASIFVFTRIHYYGVPSKRPPTSLKKMLRIPRTDKRYGDFLSSTFLVGFANWMGLSIYPIIAVDELHVTSSYYGILAAVTSAVAIVFYFIWGSYSDHHHPMVITFITFVLGITGFIVYLLAQDPIFLLIPAVVNGISNSGGDLAIINNAIRFPKEREDIPHYMALYTTLIGVRGVLAPFLVSILLIFFAPRLVLAVSFVFMLLGVLNFGIVMRRLLRDPEFADPMETPSIEKRRLFSLWSRRS